MKKGYVTLKELSTKTRIKANTLYKWAVSGRIEHYKEKNRIYVRDVTRSHLLYEGFCPVCGERFQTIYKRQKYDKPSCGSLYRVRKWAKKREEAKSDI